MGSAHNWKHKFVTRCPWNLIFCRLLILVFYSSCYEVVISQWEKERIILWFCWLLFKKTPKTSNSSKRDAHITILQQQPTRGIVYKISYDITIAEPCLDLDFQFDIKNLKYKHIMGSCFDCKWSKSNPKKSKWDSINSALNALIMNTLNHIRGRSEKSECPVCGFWLWPVLLWSITNAFLWSLNCKLGQSETKPMIDRILFENILVGVLRCLFCRSKVCKYHQLASMLTQMASWQPEYLFSFLQSDFSPFPDLSFRKIWLD